MCVGYNFSDSETKKVKFLDFNGFENTTKSEMKGIDE